MIPGLAAIRLGLVGLVPLFISDALEIKIHDNTPVAVTLVSCDLSALAFGFTPVARNPPAGAVLSAETLCTLVREFSPLSPVIAQNSSSGSFGFRLVGIAGVVEEAKAV